MAFLPWHGLPGHLQGGSLCCGAWPLPHRFPLQHTGSTSASPGHDPRRWLLRASSAPAACGWHLLWTGMNLAEGCWGVCRSPSPLFAPLGRRYPPGVVTVPTGQSYGGQRRILCPFGSRVSASCAELQSRWLHPVFAFATHRFVRSERSRGGSSALAVYPRCTPLRTSRGVGGYAVTSAPEGRGLHPHGHGVVWPYGLTACLEGCTSFQPTDRT